MEKSFNPQNFVFDVLFFGTAVLLLFAGFILLIVITAHKRFRKADVESIEMRLVNMQLNEMLESLLYQINSLQVESIDTALEREAYLARYLDDVFVLFRMVDNFALVKLENTKDWEKTCTNMYISLDEELQKLKQSTFFIKNLDLPLQQLISSYIEIINKSSRNQIDCIVKTSSIISSQSKKDIFSLLQILTLLSGKSKSYQVKIEEIGYNLIIRLEGNIVSEDVDTQLLIKRLQLIGNVNNVIVVNLSMLDNGIIEVNLPMTAAGVEVQD
ncbi:MAG: hypothetical protein P0Y49_09195 [Candidatus Pedobacter colombiensis]|uniref:Uncharacterized protein n=1 Tax=Candidatus Pedobacter colombiensis TaxID=3121371 RepID=A0AAJ6B8E9_9SPHI|nr:hypothetical protein [Pedobacter sp.]WEK21315.1 MAG: hypothetical protein P0Y49_09195 [Pedobacter sp.]